MDACGVTMSQSYAHSLSHRVVVRIKQENNISRFRSPMGRRTRVNEVNKTKANTRQPACFRGIIWCLRDPPGLHEGTTDAVQWVAGCAVIEEVPGSNLIFNMKSPNCFQYRELYGDNIWTIPYAPNRANGALLGLLVWKNTRCGPLHGSCKDCWTIGA